MINSLSKQGIKENFLSEKEYPWKKMQIFGNTKDLVSSSNLEEQNWQAYSIWFQDNTICYQGYNVDQKDRT